MWRSESHIGSIRKFRASPEDDLVASGIAVSRSPILLRDLKVGTPDVVGRIAWTYDWWSRWAHADDFFEARARLVYGCLDNDRIVSRGIRPRDRKIQSPRSRVVVNSIVYPVDRMLNARDCADSRDYQTRYQTRSLCHFF